MYTAYPLLKIEIEMLKTTFEFNVQKAMMSCSSIEIQDSAFFMYIGLQRKFPFINSSLRGHM